MGRLACIARAVYEAPHVAGASVVSGVMGASFGLAMGPREASTAIVILLVIYIASTIIYPRARFIPLSMMAAIHVTAVLAYYSNPLPLPLIILERGAMGATANIDIVQALILYEAITAYRTTHCHEDKTEKPQPPSEQAIG